MLQFLVNISFVLWGISEFLIISRKRVPQNKNIKDKNSLIQIVTLVITLPIGISFGNLANYPQWLRFPFDLSFWQAIGLILLFVGITIRWISISTLKKYFTANLTIQEDHKLITTGIYKNIRHPSYLGGLLCFAGFGIALDNYISLFFIFFINMIAILMRIDYEEKILMKEFGSEFEEYKLRTKKLLPFLF
jgi:protein-S-isoprenylcysteine O-methyltransferase Ste14